MPQALKIMPLTMLLKDSILALVMRCMHQATPPLMWVALDTTSETDERRDAGLLHPPDPLSKVSPGPSRLRVGPDEAELIFEHVGNLKVSVDVQQSVECQFSRRCEVH